MEPSALATLEDRQHHVLGMKAKKKLWEAPSAEAFMDIFVDCVECHYHAYTEGRVLHRDLSENNLMFKFGADSHVRGVLNDWDMASRVDENGENAVSNATHRTGTIPFMARDLLVDGTPPPHLYRHDLESFFYILVWAAVNYNFGADDPRKRYPVLAEWDAETLRGAAADKDSFISSPARKKMIIQRVLPTCSILLPWIHSLWSLFSKAQSHYLQDYTDDAVSKDWDHNTIGGHITFETFMKAIGRVPR
ncbi:hypothetical protein H0H93_012568 [Arthromyces matolae]|nr:hypothetical protein H0H93_012568 [Arthromyces matolae]